MPNNPTTLEPMPSRLQSYRPRHRKPSQPLVAAFLRIILVLVASAAAGVSAPSWITVPLSLGAAVLVTEWVVRGRRRGLLDAVLVGSAGLVLVLVALGVALNLTPSGLTTENWAIGLLVVGLSAILLGLRRKLPAVDVITQRQVTIELEAPPADRKLGLNVTCGLLAICVIAGAFLMAASSETATSTQPLEMSATATSDGTVAVRIDAGAEQGTFDLILIANGIRQTVATGLASGPDPIVVDLAIPAGYVQLDLVASGDTTPFRRLIFDSGQIATQTP